MAAFPGCSAIRVFLMSNSHLGSLRQLRMTLIAVLALVTSLCVVYLAVRWELEPIYMIAVAVLVPMVLFAMHKWPLVILTGLLFVGNLKAIPAQGLSLRDPTMIMLLLSAGAIFLDAFFILARATPWTVGALFRGQAAVTILFLLLCAVIAISLLYTPSVAGVMKVARFETFEVLMFFAPMLLLKRKRDVRQLFTTVVVLAVVLAARIIINLEHPSKQILNGNEDITEIGASELLGFGLLICLYGKLGKSRAIRYVCAIFLLFGVIACAARSTIVALLISLIVSACAARAGAGMLSRKAVLIGLVLAVIVAIPAFLWLRDRPAAQQKVRWKMAEVEALASGSAVRTGTVSARLGFYRSALDALKQHPIIGLGAGGWSTFYYGEDILHYYPHNFLLEVGAEQGVIGLSLLISLLAMLFRSALKLLRSDRYFAVVFPMMLFTVSYNVITGSVESREVWFICGVVAAASRMSEHLRLADHVQPRVANLEFAETFQS
jgi:O-antigen ligase